MRGSCISCSNLLAIITFKSKWILPAKTAASHCSLQLRVCFVKHFQWLCSPKRLKRFPRFWDLNNCIVQSQDSSFESSNNIRILFTWLISQETMGQMDHKKLCAVPTYNVILVTTRLILPTHYNNYKESYYFEQYCICVFVSTNHKILKPTIS